MTERKKPPFLTVVHGTEQYSTPARSMLALALKPSREEQLNLPGLLPSRTIISASPMSLLHLDLAHTLLHFKVRHFVDIRLAAEFGSLKISRQAFFALVERLEIEYHYVPALANRNFEAAENPHARWGSLREQLQKQEASRELERIGALVDDGPIILLGETPSHEDSERNIIVRELLELRSDFALQPLDPPSKVPVGVP